MQQGAAENVLSEPADDAVLRRFERFRNFLSAFSYYGFLLLVGITLLLILAAIKAKTLYANHENQWLIAYSVFVTTFELTRVLAATLYRNSINKVMRHADNILAARQEEAYEPLVTFVIPCKNEEEAIENTIRMCFAADYPADKLDVVFINDGGTDGTEDIVRTLKKEYEKRLTIVSWKVNRGKRPGMVEGFRRARGEIVIQLDSDSYIEPSTFRNLIKPFAHPEIAAVCAHADPSNADQNLLTKMQAAYYFMSFRILKAAESVFMSVFCCSGCSSAYRKSAVLPIMDDWLGERFLGQPVTWGDDRALTNWLIKTDHKTIYTDLVQAYTICPDNLRQFLKQQTRWKKSWVINAYFASKFIWRKRPFIAFTYFFPLTLVSMLTPFVAVRAMLYSPAVRHILPLYYLFGALLLAAIITVFYKFSSRSNKYWPYLFLWTVFNSIFLSFVFFYAIATIQNRKWVTR